VQIWRFERRTLRCRPIAGLFTRVHFERGDAGDPLAAVFARIEALEPVPDGSRVFVVDCAFGLSGRAWLREVDLRPDRRTAGVTTLCREVDMAVVSMCWLSSERLLVGDDRGRVHCFDLLTCEWHVVAQLPVSPLLVKTEMSASHSMRSGAACLQRLEWPFTSPTSVRLCRFS
jgi:hypothetical protein